VLSLTLPYTRRVEKRAYIKKIQSEDDKTVLYYNKEFLEFSKKNPYEVTNEDIKDYLYYLAEDKEVFTSTLNIAINALKFYYGEILKCRFIYKIKRPKKDKKLPAVLNHAEVSQIISSVGK